MFSELIIYFNDNDLYRYYVLIQLLMKTSSKANYINCDYDTQLLHNHADQVKGWIMALRE